jgi:hypothetical protein
MTTMLFLLSFSMNFYPKVVVIIRKIRKFVDKIRSLENVVVIIHKFVALNLKY